MSLSAVCMCTICFIIIIADNGDDVNSMCCVPIAVVNIYYYNNYELLSLVF